MQWNSDAWLWALGRTTLMVAVSAVIVAALLSLLRVRSTALRRAAWMIVLLQGWLAVQVPIVLERQAAPAAESVAVAEVSHPAPPVFEPAAARLTSGVVETNGDEAPVADTTQNVVAASPLIARTTPESPGRAIPWTRLLFLAWLAGALLTMTLGVYRYLAFLRLLRATEPATGEWQDEIREARVTLGIENPVELRIAAEAGPCLVRRLRESCIVAPRGLWLDLTRRQRVAILRHELAHFVRGDLWKSIAIRLLSLPQWFNPAAWWAVRRFDECAEWACDELAGGGTEGATEYSKLLLALGAAPGGRAAYLPAAHRGCVSTRIRRLVAEPRRDFRGAKVIVPLVAAGLVALNLVRIEVVAQTPGQQAGDLAVGDARGHVPWHPEELVAVLGDERASLWSNSSHILLTRDGRRVIADGGQASLFVFDADTLELLGTFGERDARIVFTMLSQDGARFMAGYGDGTMTVWNVAGDAPVLEQTVNVMPQGLKDVPLNYAHALQADRLLITTGGTRVMLWELQAGRLSRVQSFEADGDVYHAAISPDGRQVVTNFTIPLGNPIPPERIVEVNGVRQIKADCCLQLWDASGRRPKELDRLTTGNIQFLTCLPDGQTLIGNARPTATPTAVRCVKLIEGELVEQPDVEAEFGWPLLPTFSPDRRMMAIPDATGGLRLVDLSKPEWPVIASIGTWATPFGVAFTAEGDSLYLGVRSCLERWDRTETGDYVRATPQPVHASVVRDVQFRSDGESVVSAGGRAICEWDLRHLDVPDPIVHNMDLAPSASPELEWWVARGVLCLLTDSDQEQSIRLLDRLSGNFSETFHIDFGGDYRDRAWCLDIHPDGKLLATGHWDSAIRFWNLAGDTPVKTAEFESAHRGHVCDLAFSPDGTMLASVGWDHAVKLWDTSTDPPSVGGELGQHEEIVRSVAFSRDSRWVASGDEAGVIRLWDLKSEDLSGPTIVHPDDVAHPKSMYDGRTINTLEFSADGRRLLSADGAGRVIVWSVPSGKIIKEWKFPGWVWAARWSPDESLIATGNQNGTVYLLAAPE